MHHNVVIMVKLSNEPMDVKLELEAISFLYSSIDLTWLKKLSLNAGNHRQIPLISIILIADGQKVTITTVNTIEL